MAAAWVKENGQANLYYIHTDHLGSICAITDEDQNVTANYSFDAWGNRRDPNTWELTDTWDESFTARGFTGHEHIDEFGLINMNGRVYDPTIGQFLSPDNYVQLPDYSLGFNRYSYALNNPLKFTDPSGELLHFLFHPIFTLAGQAAITYMFAKPGMEVASAQGYSSTDWQYYGYAAGSAAINYGAVAASVFTAGAAAPAFGAGWATVMGAATGGFVGKAGIAGLSGASFSEAMKQGAIGAATGIIGGVGGSLGGIPGALIGGALGSGSYAAMTGGSGEEIAFAAALGGITSLAMYIGMSHGAFQNDPLRNKYGDKYTFRHFLRRQGDFQRAEFWKKEYSGFFIEGGGVKGAPAKTRATHGINWNTDIPEDAFAFYHTHWDVNNRAIYVDRLGNEITDQWRINALEKLNVPKSITTCYHGNSDYMSIDSWVMNRYGSISYNRGGTGYLSVYKDVFRRTIPIFIW